MLRSRDRELRDESRIRALGCDDRPQQPADVTGVDVLLPAKAS